MFSRITRCVSAVVRVMPQAICGTEMRSVRNEKGIGFSSASCISNCSQAIVALSSRAGVPVFRRPSLRSRAARSSLSPRLGASPHPSSGITLVTNVMSPRRKVPVVSTTALERRTCPEESTTPFISEPTRRNFSTAPSWIVKFSCLRAIPGPHRGRACGHLCSWPPDCRTLLPIQHAELNPTEIGSTPHNPIKSVDFTHQVALAQNRQSQDCMTSSRSCAVYASRARSKRAYPRCSGGCLSSGMSTANDDNVELTCCHEWPRAFVSRESLPTQNSEKILPKSISVSIHQSADRVHPKRGEDPPHAVPMACAYAQAQRGDKTLLIQYSAFCRKRLEPQRSTPRSAS